MAVILVVDNDGPARAWACRTTRALGHEVFEAADGHSAISLGRRVTPRLALLDHRLPGPSGLQVFQALRAKDQDLIGVILTSYGSVEHAFECAKSGMAAYLERPLHTERFQEVVRDLLDRLGIAKPAPEGIGGLVGTSKPMRVVYRQIQRFAPLNETVLITGETGTGKELVARAIHRCSARTSNTYVDVNCAAVPSSLFESEFFGHERGAFTDAQERHVGHFERASGGTLFLDEVGELSNEAQGKLLRAIEQREVRRIGSVAPVAVNVRLIAATNLDLSEAVTRRAFRPDLLHRLNALTIRLPPLRERLEDLAALAEHFLGHLRREHERPATVLSPSALRRLHDHGWSGNIRELQNTIRQAFLAADGTEISADHIELCCWNSTAAVAGRGTAVPHGMTLAESLREQEREWLAAELSRHQQLASAAKALGIDPKTLYGKRKRYGL